MDPRSIVGPMNSKTGRPKGEEKEIVKLRLNATEAAMIRKWYGDRSCDSFIKGGLQQTAEVITKEKVVYVQNQSPDTMALLDNIDDLDKKVKKLEADIQTILGANEGDQFQWLLKEYNNIKNPEAPKKSVWDQER